MDKLTPEQRRKNMQAVKSKGSVIESLLGSELWRRGLRYRRNNRKILGNPDFVFLKKKLAIFVDSEFWHGKNWEEKKHEHKSNVEFWHQKIEKNIERDKQVNEYLQKEGWIILRFWGQELKKNLVSCADKIEKCLK